MARAARNEIAVLISPSSVLAAEDGGLSDLFT